MTTICSKDNKVFDVKVHKNRCPQCGTEAPIPPHMDANHKRVPASVEQILEHGYTQDEAEKIHARETERWKRGEEPYDAPAPAAD